jgi:predicted XRE-type DNA-binding protein
MKKQKFPSEFELKEVRQKLSKGPAARPLSKSANPLDRLKHALCAEFVKFKNVNHLTQKGLAQKVGIDDALISKIVNYSYDEFTVDRLLKYLSVLYPNIDVRLLVA